MWPRLLVANYRTEFLLDITGMRRRVCPLFPGVLTPGAQTRGTEKIPYGRTSKVGEAANWVARCGEAMLVLSLFNLSLRTFVRK